MFPSLNRHLNDCNNDGITVTQGRRVQRARATDRPCFAANSSFTKTFLASPAACMSCASRPSSTDTLRRLLDWADGKRTPLVPREERDERDATFAADLFYERRRIARRALAMHVTQALQANLYNAARQGHAPAELYIGANLAGYPSGYAFELSGSTVRVA